ncbi:hypothetical protein P7D22_19555 [Lichenihabitans sp. Uapishka_5]|uniref:hypothetical protein n=1 Tax=Lichenihabitans sp. Uapishka_5 TaxID=3037302 RepID=UPI0029E80549|nr:hypothetical protein [Lichenihabitans sp. Uapishka_5]MDX7953364.1 hypothetical protein [Lichenihabitans sp. Uapishka_5]
MMRRLLARFGAALVRLDQPDPKPTPDANDGRYGFEEHKRWRGPDVPSRLGWLERKPERPFRSDNDLF